MDCKQQGFLIRLDMEENVMLLSDEEAGIVFKACYLHFYGKELPAMSIPCQMVFNMIRKKMDENRESYEEKCRKRREAGAAGGRAKKQNQAEGSITKQTVAKGSIAKKSVANVADNDSDYDSDSDSDFDSDSKSKEKKQAKRKSHLTLDEAKQMVTERNLPAPVASVLDDWLEYKAERKEHYQEIGLRKLLTMVEKQLAESDVKTVVDAINKCIASGYKGIFFDGKRASPKPDRYKVVDDWLAHETDDMPFG